jgi:hypothetical protein
LNKLPSVNNSTLYRDVKNPDDIESSLKYYSENVINEIIAKILCQLTNLTEDGQTKKQVFNYGETNESNNTKDLYNISFCT